MKLGVVTSSFFYVCRASSITRWCKSAMWVCRDQALADSKGVSTVRHSLKEA